MRKIVKIVTFYDDGTFSESNPSAPYSPMPVIPMNPPFSPVPHTEWPKTCSKCGLKLESVMGYVCNNHPCPTGLGGAWCMTNE